MNEEQYNQEEEDHTRTIVHVHVDYFYIQVEVHRNPYLSNKPIAIQQNDTITTTNYEARECGIKRMMNVDEALNLCPQLVLMNRNPESFHNYRQISYSITAHLQKYSSCVERLGLDENYVDISDIIQQRLGETCTLIGEVFNKSNVVCCLCGCYDRLKLATKVVNEIRDSIRTEFKLLTRAGIAHNKLIAKLASEVHKPDKQTVIFPPNGRALVLQKSIDELPGLSKSVRNALHDLRINTISELREHTALTLFPMERAKYLQELALGIDHSPVKGRFVSLEDVHRPMSIESEVKDTLDSLLKRLIALVYKGGRIPRRIELLVRKYDHSAKISHKEVKYSNLSPKLFMGEKDMHVTDDSERKLLSITMKLFLKAVDVTRPYHVTLLGLSFRKFRESMRVCRTAATLVNPLLEEKVEVQTVTSIQSKCDYSSMYMDTANGYSGHSDNTDGGSESELEPSPKKKKFNFIRSSRCFRSECPSPSKLNVAQLRITSES